ncbi:MAG: histidinol-phosphate transaminase [Chloroflexota bacterium]
MDQSRFVREDIVAMEPYTPILPFEVLSRKLGRAPEDIIKLDANENPYGPSPKALAALKAGQFFHIYPDPEATQLREALAKYTNTPLDNILCGMGADELIDLVLRVMLSPGDVVIDCPPSFGMYPFSTVVNGGNYVKVPRRADFSLDIEGIETAVSTHPNTKVLFLCSPNNPNGSLIPEDELRHLLALPVLVVLDEAYIDFAEVDGAQSRMSWVQEYDNLAVLRTFSKLAGLAGLRVGYGAFPQWLLPHILKIKQPYNINVAAGLAAVASLEDEDWLREKVGLLVAERARLEQELAKISFLEPYPSHSNFVLSRVNGRSAQQLKLDLEQEGILVRYFNKPGLDNCIRISAGRPKQIERLLAVLHQFDS